MEFDNLVFKNDEDRLHRVLYLLDQANNLLDEAYEAHLKEVKRRASLSGEKVRKAFGNG